MERSTLTDQDSTEVVSPPTYRLRWDAGGLVLERRLAEGEYAQLASSAITFSPNPAVLVHPELKLIVEQAIQQLISDSVPEGERISIAIAPPWGSAWMLPLGKLNKVDIPEQIRWELRQRLQQPLAEYVYAWHNINNSAYIVAIRPELLIFWEEQLQQHNLALGEFYLIPKLTDHSIENEADLLPLFRKRSDRVGGLETEIEHRLVIRSELPAQAEDSSNDDIVNAFAEFEIELHKKARRDMLLAGMAVIAVGLIIFAVFFQNPPWTEFEPFVIETPVETQITDQQPVSDEQVETETQTETGDEQLVNDQEDIVQLQQSATTDELQQQATPPGTIRSGTMLSRLFQSASAHDIALTSVILQGSDIMVEVFGPEEIVQQWRDEFKEDPAVQVVPREGRADLYSFLLDTPSERELSRDEFNMWAVELGMRGLDANSFSADRPVIDNLFDRITGTGRRPWHLSLHRANDNSYYVTMLP